MNEGFTRPVRGGFCRGRIYAAPTKTNFPSSGFSTPPYPPGQGGEKSGMRTLRKSLFTDENIKSTPPLRGSRRGRALGRRPIRWGELFLWDVPPPIRLRAYALSLSTPPQGGSEIQKLALNQNRSTTLFLAPLTRGVGGGAFKEGGRGFARKRPSQGIGAAPSH